MTTTKVFNKYSGKLLAQVPMISDVEMILEQAIKSHKLLQQIPATQRAEKLKRLSQLIHEHSDELAQLICSEAGKPITYAKGELIRCVATVDIAADECKKIKDTVINISKDKTGVIRRFVTGPILGISPFNFPLNLSLHKIAPALAVGTSVVLKPSPFTPLSAIRLSELIEESGFPNGSVQIVNCSNEVSESLVRDPRFSMMSFTGSPQVGWMLKNIVGKKKIALELGGNAPVIIEDAHDLAQVAKTVAIGAYLYAGQICISTQRILVNQKIRDEFQLLLLDSISTLSVGDPQDKSVLVGPMIDKFHVERMQEWVNEAKKGGAVVLCGGKIKNLEHNLYPPTLLTGTDSSMKVSRDEVFGPIAVIESYGKFEEALELANDSVFGLQAGIFTNDEKKIELSFNKLEFGGVMINDVPGFRVDHMPYGGVKDSGLGREGVRYTMDEMTELRLLVR
jgi:acyl-CoA reductase-like NAD-dependent aldehyde dehydrogenase